MAELIGNWLLHALGFIALIVLSYAAGSGLRRIVEGFAVRRIMAKRTRRRRKESALANFGGDMSGEAGILLAQLMVEPDADLSRAEGEDPRRA